MTFNWKQALGSVALSAMALSMIGTGGAVAQTKPDTVKPNPPTAEKIETGQLLIKDKPRPPAVEKGIKDQGVKSCNGCGMTGKEAAPPPVDDAAAPPSAEKIETGQLLIKDRPKLVNERRANSGPGGTPPAAKNELCGLPYTPKCVTNATAKKGSNTGLILGITAGAAALAAVLASGNNDDRPTSP